MTLHTKANIAYQANEIDGNAIDTKNVLFIGYTTRQPLQRPLYIESQLFLESSFGEMDMLRFQLSPDEVLDYRLKILKDRPSHLAKVVKAFLAQHNRPCQVLSLGTTTQTPRLDDFLAVRPLLEKEQYSLVIAPDAALLSDKEQKILHQAFEKYPTTLSTSASPFALAAEPKKNSQRFLEFPPSILNIANPCVLMDLLRWEAGQYLQEQIITPRRYEAIMRRISAILNAPKESAAVQEQLLVYSPLLEDILHDMQLMAMAQ